MGAGFSVEGLVTNERRIPGDRFKALFRRRGPAEKIAAVDERTGRAFVRALGIFGIEFHADGAPVMDEKLAVAARRIEQPSSPDTALVGNFNLPRG